MRFLVGILLASACASAPAQRQVHGEHRVAVAKGDASDLLEPEGYAERKRGTHASGAYVRVAKLTPDVVLATIKGRYIAGVERCYRRHLKKDAGARGRVLVSFTVDPNGRARDGAARGITERVDDCIEAQVRRWRFPAPRAESRFALGLQLGSS